MNREDSAKVGGWLDHASKMARTVAEHNAEETIAALMTERDNALAALRRRSAQRDQLDARCEELTARAERAEAAIRRVRQVERQLWQQVAQLQAIWVEQQAEMDPFDRGGLNGLKEAHGLLLAALDSTDPVEDAPEQSTADWWMQIALNTANRYGALLAEILRHFTEKGHPGRPCLRTGWVDEETVAQWRTHAADRSDSRLPVDGEERK